MIPAYPTLRGVAAPGESAGGGGPPARLAFGALLLAVLARLPFAVFYPGFPRDRSNDYMMQARDLMHFGEHFGRGDFHRLPGAPLFFAACMTLVGDHPGVLVLIEHAAGVALVALLMGWAWRYWGPWESALTGFLLALDFQLPFHECFLLSELAVQLYFVAALLLTLTWIRVLGSPRPWRWLLAGSAAALPGLTRGEFLIMGPVIAAALCLPGGAVRGVGRVLRLGAFSAGWLFCVGGWVLVSWTVLGYAGVNLQGPTILLDSVLPLVRYDLPTEPAAKRLLREEAARIPQTGMDARPAAWDRLQREYGYTYLQAGSALKAVAYEAIRTQPWAYLALVRRNLWTYWIPIPWVFECDHDALWTGGLAGPDSAGRILFLKVLSVDQYWGWGVLFLACLSPIAWVYADPSRRWDITLLWGLYLGLCLDLALVRQAVERFQCTLYLPLVLLASCTVAAVKDGLVPDMRSRWARRGGRS